MAELLSLLVGERCARCGAERVCSSWGGEWLCLRCLGEAAYHNWPIHDLTRLDGMDVPCPACAASGSIACPWLCHGVGRCPDCGGSGQLVCTLCQGQRQVPVGCVHAYPDEAVEAAAAAHLGAHPSPLAPGPV